MVSTNTNLRKKSWQQIELKIRTSSEVHKEMYKSAYNSTKGTTSENILSISAQCALKGRNYLKFSEVHL